MREIVGEGMKVTMSPRIIKDKFQRIWGLKLCEKLSRSMLETTCLGDGECDGDGDGDGDGNCN